MKKIIAIYKNKLPEINEQQSKGEFLALYDGKNSPPELATQVTCYWNNHFLQILFQGRYNNLRTATAEINSDKLQKTMYLWEISDVFEAFISPDRSSRYKEFQCAPDGRYIDIAIDSSGIERISDFSWKSGISVKSLLINEKKLWISEMKIPWDAFGTQRPQPQEEWSANFYRISGPESDLHYLSWAPVFKINFHQPELFGRIIFQMKA